MEFPIFGTSWFLLESEILYRNASRANGARDSLAQPNGLGRLKTCDYRLTAVHRPPAFAKASAGKPSTACPP